MIDQLCHAQILDEPDITVLPELQQQNAGTGLVVAGFDEAICYGPKDIERSFFNCNIALLSADIGAG